MATNLKKGSDGPVRDVSEEVKDSDAEKRARRLAFVFERARRDEVTELNVAREEGYRIGLEEARQEGRAEGKSEKLLLLLELKFKTLPAWVKPKLNYASEEQLIQWSMKLFWADTLDQVFEV